MTSMAVDRTHQHAASGAARTAGAESHDQHGHKDLSVTQILCICLAVAGFTILALSLVLGQAFRAVDHQRERLDNLGDKTNNQQIELNDQQAQIADLQHQVRDMRAGR